MRFPASLFLILAFPLALQAQNVGINPTGAPPHPSAMLDVAGTTGGLLIPRMSTVQRDGIPAPATSLLVFNTTTQRFEFFDGTQWRPLLAGGGAWETGGNAGTDPNVDYLGTTDAQDLVLRTNGTEHVRLSAAGDLGVGTNAPAERLHVVGNIRMDDGSQAAGRVLTSDANGTGTWQEVERPDYYGVLGTTSDTATTSFTLLDEMQLNVVPQDSTLIVHFSAAGITDPFCSSGYASFQLRINGVAVEAFYAHSWTAWSLPNLGAYRVGHTYPVEVVPGTSVSIEIFWRKVFCTANMINGPGTGLPDVGSFRSLVVVDPKGNGQTAFSGVPYSNDHWNLEGNGGTDPAAQFIGTTDTAALVFRTNGIERMRISGFGGWGLGTSVGLGFNGIRIIGDLRLENGTQAAGRVLTSNALGTGTWQEASQAAWGLTGNVGTDPATNYLGTAGAQPLVVRTNAMERLRITENGLVGIGTAAPGALLSLSRPTQAATEQLELRNVGGITDGNYDGIRWTQGATGTTTLGSIRVHYHNNGTTDLSLSTRFNAQAVFIEHGGEVGMGTTTPDRRLEVSGAGTQYARITSTSGGIAGIELLRPGGGSDWQVRNAAGLLLFGQSNDDLATVTDVLRLGGASVTPATDNTITLGQGILRWTQVFAVNGVIQTSDRRLKTDIEPLSGALDAVLRLRPVRYRWKDDPSGPVKIGLLAQEVREVVPEVVIGTEGAGEYLGLNYAELVPLLIGAVQDLDARITSLEQGNERLRSALGEHEGQRP